MTDKKRSLVLSHAGLLRALCRNEITFADLETALMYLDYDGGSADPNYTALRVLGRGNVATAMHALTNSTINKAIADERFSAQPANGCDLHQVGYEAVSGLLQKHGYPITLKNSSNFGYHPGLVEFQVDLAGLPLAVIQ